MCACVGWLQRERERERAGGAGCLQDYQSVLLILHPLDLFGRLCPDLLLRRRSLGLLVNALLLLLVDALLFLVVLLLLRPEDVNRTQPQITSTSQHPVSTATT